MEKPTNAYTLGRIIAIVETLLDKTPSFASVCVLNPLDKLVPNFVFASREANSSLLIRAVRDLDGNYQFPASLNNQEQGQAWMGYYHELATIKARRESGRERRAKAANADEETVAEETAAEETVAE